MMKSKNETVRSGGVSFSGLLTCIFIALKLMGTITWSWFWVLSPTLLPLSIIILIILLVGIVGLLEANK